jgi:DNA-directed RNA polymerase III subunit RPC1
MSSQAVVKQIAGV